MKNLEISKIIDYLIHPSFIIFSVKMYAIKLLFLIDLISFKTSINIELYFISINRLIDAFLLHPGTLILLYEQKKYNLDHQA